MATTSDNYERENKYLLEILKDDKTFIGLLTTVLEILELLREPFIKPKIYTELYDALCSLYLSPPTKTNGSFFGKIEKALNAMALPFPRTQPENLLKSYDELNKDEKKYLVEAAQIVPRLLMQRKLADVVLDKIIPNYPQKLIAEKLNIDIGDVVPDASLIDDLGADSLAIVELVMSIEEEFGLEVPDEDLEKMTTVKDAIEYVSEQKPFPKKDH